METRGDNRSSVVMETGLATNTSERELHQTSPLTEQGNVNTNNNHFDVHSSSSLSQNPFLVPSDATNNKGDGCKSNDNTSNTNHAGSQSETTHHSLTENMLGLHSSFTPSTNESSQGNPFHEPTNNKRPNVALESYQNQPSAHETVPINVESRNPFQVTEQGHHQGMVNNNNNIEHIHVSSLNTTNKSHTDAESSDDVIQINSMPKQEQHSVVIAHSSNCETNTNQGSEIQNPPMQVMERPGESSTTSQYVFPSHVFDRNNPNATVEWSTASNESLFSIYMGNMSFSNELGCFKSCELDKPGDVCMVDQPNASLSHQPNASSPSHQPPASLNKFNNISQRSVELHEESLKKNEAIAAETMREVIMENSQTTENVRKREDKASNSHRQSDGSNNSYAFQSSKGRDKNISSKSVTEKQNEQKQSEEKETPNPTDQTQKSTTNGPPNKWLSCFACCTFCH